jgi:hypothetical protein
MVQVIQMAHDEKVAMYKKLSKQALIEMLIESNRILDMVLEQRNTPYILPTQPLPNPYLTDPYSPYQPNNPYSPFATWVTTQNS